VDSTKVAILAITFIALFSIFAIGYWKVEGKEMVIAAAAVSGLTGFIGGWMYAKATTEKPSGEVNTNVSSESK
jgi:hypothetical protein